MASTDAKPVPQKNVACRCTFPILDADGDLVSGAATLDSEVSKDGGAFADCTNEATEIATSSGMYFLDLTAAEMNADTVAVIVKTSTAGAKTTVIVMYPEEAGDIRVNATQISSSTAAADNLEANIGNLDAAVSGRATPAQVNTEVTSVLVTNTYAEPGQGAPGATVSLKDKIGYIYKFLRNRVVVTSSQIKVYADDATTVDQKSAHSDDGTTYDRGEFATGP